MGADAILRQVDSAAEFGGVDCVLLHPDYLQDHGANSLLAALRERNHCVCAFGWTEVGRQRHLAIRYSVMLDTLYNDLLFQQAGSVTRLVLAVCTVL